MSDPCIGLCDLCGDEEAPLTLLPIRGFSVPAWVCVACAEAADRLAS
jgi:hypothetical protein